MNRAPHRFALATLAGLAALLFAGIAPAQGLSVDTPNYSTSGPQAEISFELTAASGSAWAGKDTLLVCYASVADDGHEWSKSLQDIVGAVARISATHDPANGENWAGGISGVTATAANGTYTLPRSLISNMATEVNWGSATDFVKPLGANGVLAWPTAGWLMNAGSSMNWGSLGTGSSGVFSSTDLLNRCLTLQVAAWLDKPETNSTVQSYVESLMEVFYAEMLSEGDGANFDINIMAVQIDPGSGGGSPVLKLSLPHKVRIQSPAAGSGADAYLMLGDAFPCNVDTILRAPYVYDPLVTIPFGYYYFVLPTGNGYQLEPATLFYGFHSVGFECRTPVNVSTTAMAPFAIWESSSNTYIPMAHSGADPFVAYLLFSLPTPID